MKQFKPLNFILLALLFGRGLLGAQPLLPNPVYGLQAAVNWDLQYANGDLDGTGIHNGTPYGGTNTLGFMEGVPTYYSWYLPNAVPQPIQPPSTWNSSFIGATSLHAYDQVYKISGSGIHPNCRVELGPMRFMVHLISSGQWVDLTSTVGPLGGAAFVEDFNNNESTGPDMQSLSNGVTSVRAGIGNAQPTTSGAAGGTDTRGVGYLFHGFPSPQPTISGTLASIDAALAFQQIRCVGPDAQYTPYLCNVGIDYAEETGVSGGLFVPATTNWQWYTCYVGPVSLISSIPEPNANYVFASGVTMSQTSASIAGGASLQLTATVDPTNASDAGLIWSSSNPGVAFVGLDGLVTAYAVGTATITAMSQDNHGLTATCAMTVTNSPSFSIVNAGNANDGITYGGDGFFNLRAGDINGDERFLVDSSCYAQYTFSGTGVDVIGFKPGGSYGANFNIFVDGILSATGSTTSGTDQFQAVLGSVAGLSNGSHTVKIAFSSGIGSSPLVILDAFKIYTSSQIVPVTAVTVSPTTATVNVGAAKQMTATVSPANASNKGVIWSSSNPNVVFVNTAGWVGGVSDGTATVTATAQDGNYSASSTITVTGSSSPVVNAGNASDGITYSGGWFNTRTGDLGNDERMMNNGACYAQYTFYGDGVDVIGFLPGGSNYGAYYTIFVDGSPLVSGNTTSTHDQFQVVLGSITNLNNGVHTVNIAFEGAIGSSAYVILDAFKIHNAPTPPLITGFSTAQNGTSFTVAGTGLASQSYVLLAASSLALPVTWVPVQTNVANISGAFSFTDFGMSNYNQRFYRVQQGQ